MSHAGNLRVLMLVLVSVVVICAGSLVASSPADADAPTRARAVQLAKSYLGTPYKYGGTTNRGMDCSGLVYRVYHYKLGLDIPRTAKDQWKWTGDVARVSLAETRPGDLVFFDFDGNRVVDHVGIAVERNGRLLQINATVPGESVRYSPIYRDAYVGSKRWLRR